VIIYSYRLVTSADRRAALLSALAALAQTLEGRAGLIGTTLHRALDAADSYRFEECWQSAEAHDAAMDPTLKTALKAILGELTEPARTERFESSPTSPSSSRA
jgi:quinol monooxygenase YgiN